VNLELLKNPPEEFDKLFVGLSGGLDSVALLYLLLDKYSVSLPGKKKKKNSLIEVVHVNHNLQSDSQKFQDFCEMICKNAGVKLRCISVKVLESEKKKFGIEAAARKRRYEAFASIIDNSKDLLVLGHHLDDQLETVFLQWIRGAGLNGLTGMIEFSKKTILNKIVKVWRPILGFSREEIYAYAVQNKLDWVEDHSNKNLDFDRNNLRAHIIPKLVLMRKGAKKNMYRSIKHLQNVRDNMNLMLNESLSECVKIQEIDEVFGNSSVLVKSKFLKLDNELQPEVLRLWLFKGGCKMPSSARLKEIIRQVKFSSSRSLYFKLESEEKSFCITASKTEISLSVII
tara:strand:- start:48057 stop:49082 length:1026 start_codon:yes stop_codon:yes gene_type:complete